MFVCVQFAQGEYNSSGFDLNVMPVWRNNITGSGVVVSIIDDGESNIAVAHVLIGNIQTSS